MPVTEIGFLGFGLGFFLFVIWFITHQDTIRYERRLNEMREFGLHQEESDTPTRKSRKQK